MTIAEKLNALAEMVGGRAWGLDRGKPRIYMPSSRDRKIYFEFPDVAGTSSDAEDAVHVLGGAVLKVFIDDCGQSPNWYASQRRLAVERNYAAALAIQAFDFDPARAAAIMEADEITATQIDVAGHAFANGHVEEAFAAIFDEVR